MSDWKDEILKEWDKKRAAKGEFITDSVRDRLIKELKGEVLYREPMSKHTSMRVGGLADVFFKPADIEDLKNIYRIAHEENIPLTLIGAGSNTLVKDGGIRGFVVTPPITLNECTFRNVSNEAGEIEIGANVKITRAVHFAKENFLTGLEEWVGIPGSIGGAILMNAGAHGLEAKDVIREITVLDKDGQILTYPCEKLDFEYRKLKLPKTTMILSGVFRLNKASGEDIVQKIEKFQKWRVEKQPLNYPNLGSVFKNPQPLKKGEVAVSAGKLIEEAGLKNVRVGGARISEKHANFIINEENAKARDVLVLINLVKDKIKESTGIVLETEVKIIGEDL